MVERGHSPNTRRGKTSKKPRSGGRKPSTGSPATERAQGFHVGDRVWLRRTPSTHGTIVELYGRAASLRAVVRLDEPSDDPDVVSVPLQYIELAQDFGAAELQGGAWLPAYRFLSECASAITRAVRELRIPFTLETNPGIADTPLDMLLRVKDADKQHVIVVETKHNLSSPFKFGSQDVHSLAEVARRTPEKITGILLITAHPLPEPARQAVNQIPQMRAVFWRFGSHDFGLLKAAVRDLLEMDGVD